MLYNCMGPYVYLLTFDVFCEDVHPVNVQNFTILTQHNDIRSLLSTSTNTTHTF